VIPSESVNGTLQQAAPRKWGCAKNGTKSRRFRRIIGLQSHCIRLMQSLKPDCGCALRRKTPEDSPSWFDGTLSPVQFGGKTCGIAANFSDSYTNAARFLCSTDCVAERVGFNSPLFTLTRMNTGDNA